MALAPWFKLLALGTLCDGELLRVALSSGDRRALVTELKALRSTEKQFTVLHIGPPVDLWSRDIADGIVDHRQHWPLDCWPGIEEFGSWCCRSGGPRCFDAQFTFTRCCDAGSGERRAPIRHFVARLNQSHRWAELRSYVGKHGKFDFAICSHVLQRLPAPGVLLEVLPAVAEAGFVAIPSPVAELAEQGEHDRGPRLHPWLFGVSAGTLVGLPTSHVLEAGAFLAPSEQSTPDGRELSFWWNGSLPYELLWAGQAAGDATVAQKWYHSAVVPWLRAALPHGIPATGPHEEFGCPGRPPPGTNPASYLKYAEGTAIVTYVSPRRLAYVDGAVLLGLSLQEHAPGVRTMALIEEIDNPPVGYVESILRNSGWELLVAVPKMTPPNAPPNSPNDGLHAKALLFNPDVVPFPRFVYLDSDAWVRSPRIMELLRPDLVSPEKPVMMTEDLNAPGMFSTGVMVAQPDRRFFQTLFPIVMAGHDNDQPAVNEAYRGRIAALDPAFNVHSSLLLRGGLEPADAVVVHFTGQVPFKPMHADADHLREVRRGRGADPEYGLQGGGCLFAEYFAWMAGEERLRRVSRELRRAVSEALL